MACGSGAAPCLAAAAWGAGRPAVASRGASLRKGWPREDARPVCRARTPSQQGSGHSFLRAFLPHPRAAVSPSPFTAPDPLQGTQGTVVNFAPKGPGAIGVGCPPHPPPPAREAKPNCAETWASGPEPQCHGVLPTPPGKGPWPPLGAGLQLEGGLGCPQGPERLSVVCPSSKEASQSPEADLMEPLASPREPTTRRPA